MANNPQLLKMPLARDGQKNTIPETTDATSGLFSQQYGWQSINALPPQAGGKAVKREDFNGAFNLLGGIAFMAQKGFTFKWSADQDYYAGCMVIDDTDGLRYECIADVTANDTAPSADATHWQLFSAGTDIDAWFRQASTVYSVDDMRCNESLPYGYYLICITAGTTSASDLVITSPTVGDTVTDGTVVWTIDKIGAGGSSGGGTPTGTILAYASNGALPDGYLSCDGSAVSRTTYADLFAAIGTTWGSGDGSTTFNLPSLNGYWLKGSSSAGSSVSAGLPNITGAISQFRSHGSASKSGAFSGSVAGTVSMGNYGNTSSNNNYINISFSAANSNSLYGSSSTVSVSSKTVRFIIKY